MEKKVCRLFKHSPPLEKNGYFNNWSLKGSSMAVPWNLSF